MKKLLIWCVLLLLPIHVFAVSKSDIDTYRERYKYWGNSANLGGLMYWDLESAKKVRSEYPIYRMEAKQYGVFSQTEYSHVIEQTYLLDFDYNRSCEMLRKEVVDQFIQEHGSLQMDTPIDNLARVEQQKNMGIRLKGIHYRVFDLNGALIEEHDNDVDLVMQYSPGKVMDVINAMFYKCYGFNFLYPGL